MTIKIEIELHPDRGAMDVQLSNAMLALGYERRTPTLREVAEAAHDAGIKFEMHREPKPGQTLNPDGEPASEGVPPEATATRKRGEPSPGKARRTKAEIAQDEAAEQAEAQSNIRSGAEDRVDPDQVDDGATAEQDQADEQAEVDEKRDEDAELTIDDVKAVVNAYVAAYGMPAVQEDGPKIFKEALGAPPEGEAHWKFSILPTDQASLKKLVSIWEKAVELNPLKRART